MTEHIAAVEPLPCAENAVAAQDVVAVDFFFFFFLIIPRDKVLVRFSHPVWDSYWRCRLALLAIL